MACAEFTEIGENEHDNGASRAGVFQSRMSRRIGDLIIIVIADIYIYFTENSKSVVTLPRVRQPPIAEIDDFKKKHTRRRIIFDQW